MILVEMIFCSPFSYCDYYFYTDWYEQNLPKGQSSSSMYSCVQSSSKEEKE
jgi:hypothetical protein